MSFFHVRRSRYGKVAYLVFEVVKETAKTHSIIGMDWQGKWDRRPTLVRDPVPASGRFPDLESAEAACALANAAWDAQTPLVDQANEAHKAAVLARAAAAEAVLASASSQ